MKHSLASNASLESLDTQTTISSSSSSSCCYDSEDDSEDTARLEDDNDVENSQLLLQQEQQQQSLSNQQKKKKKKQLSWGTVQIREYSRTIGDHPDVSYGPPLSLDWQYNQHEDISLDSHEQSRIVDGNGKKKRFIRMSSLTRRNLLANEFLIPHADLRRAELVVEKVQRRRAQSNRQGTFSAKLEDGLQSFRRQLGRRFSVSREVVFAAMSASSGPFSSSFTGMNGMTMASMSMWFDTMW